jgi:hypothetical protein
MQYSYLSLRSSGISTSFSLLLASSCRVGTDIDPKYDRLLRFEEEESPWAVYIFGVLVCGVAYLLTRLVRLNSYTINLTVRRAKQYANLEEQGQLRRYVRSAAPTATKRYSGSQFWMAKLD